MKKIILGILTLGVMISLAACSSSEEKTNTSSSVKQLDESSTIDSAAEEEKKMKEVEEGLEARGVVVARYNGFLKLSREKGIDYDYFNMNFVISSKKNEIFEIILILKGNIDGEEKDGLYYRVSQNRIVEAPYSNTDITAMAEVLESLGYSDQELVEFALWYYENNK
ncbi:hypothetical protein IW492_01850 [Enterococcus sp. BWB1-3]|uniref:hypothetical protein n=1 Tax=Enterococcus sp. BWB1-3 TaxID=2787713 RepID=UPI001921318C|nr:hypothetical protein [Enterococcus sp. BWB1-3]MBL1227972.1 hypothetical protein [Enterococcus sp. BWB1-3]